MTTVGPVPGRALAVVVLAPSVEVVAEREQTRPKTAYRDGYHTIRDLDHGLRHETPRIGLWIDSSAQTPDETVDEIEARALGEGLVA